MAFKVVFTGASRKDISEIVTHIADDSPIAALRFHDDLLNRCEALSAMPAIGAEVHPKIRRLVFGNYLIFYRVLMDHVQIIRIIHGARQIPPSLGG